MKNLYKRKHTIGNCTLYQADCLDIIPLLGKIDAIITDPPYASGGLHIGKRNRDTNSKYIGKTNKDYLNFSGDQKDQQSQAWWLTGILSRIIRQSARKGTFVGVFTDWRQYGLTSNVLQASNVKFAGCFVWDKTEAVRPILGRHRNQCEFLLWGHVGGHKPAGKVYAGLYRHSPSGMKKQHPTEKNVTLMEKIIEPCGTVIIDPFMGGGTTGVACVNLDREFIGIELEEKYFDIACERITHAYQNKSP